MSLKQNLTLKDFTTHCFITREEIGEVLGKRRFKKFEDWMEGQTQSMYGVYPWDLDRFLKGLPVID